MAKQKDKKKWIIIAIIALLLLWYSLQNGLLKSMINNGGGSGTGGGGTNNQNANADSSNIACGLIGQANAFKDNINAQQDCYAAASQDCSNKGLVPETAYGYQLNGKCCTWKCVVSQPKICSDSDSGQNYEIKGTCTSTGSEPVYTDYCWPGTNEVYEFSCDVNNDCAGNKYDCSSTGGICWQGMCVPSSHCSSACLTVPHLGYVGGLCVAYNSGGAMSMSQTCTQKGGTYESTLGDMCASGNICCCVS